MDTKTISSREDIIRYRTLRVAEAIANKPSIAERYRESWYVVEDRRSGELSKFKTLSANSEPIISDMNSHSKVSFALPNGTYWSILIEKRYLEEIEESASFSPN